MLRRILSRLRESDGLTLPELLIAAVLGLIVLTAAFSVLRTTSAGQVEQSERAGQIQQARFMVERITREVRQGSGVVSAGASTLELLTWVDSASCGGPSSSTAIECRVTYVCSGSTCSREETDADVEATGAGAQIVEGLNSTDVFSYSPPAGTPTFVEVELELADDEGESVTVEGGVTLRNAVVG